MKNFWKDYGALCKETGLFYKKHWKGCLVLNAVIIGGEVAWFKYKQNQFDNLLVTVNLKEDEAQK